MLEPGSFIATLERLWNRSGVLLWAIAIASLVAAAGLWIAARIDPVTFGSASQATTPWLLAIGLASLILAVFRGYYDQSHPPVRFVANVPQSFLHVAKQPDGSFVTQIAARFEVLNLSDQPIYLPEVRLRKPRTGAEIIHKTLFVRQHNGNMFGRNIIPAGCKSDATADIMIRGDILGSAKRNVNVRLRITDQYGRRHSAWVRNARVI